jgi:hypothetical protein
MGSKNSAAHSAKGNLLPRILCLNCKFFFIGLIGLYRKGQYREKYITEKIKGVLQFDSPERVKDNNRGGIGDRRVYEEFGDAVYHDQGEVSYYDDVILRKIKDVDAHVRGIETSCRKRGVSGRDAGGEQD